MSAYGRKRVMIARRGRESGVALVISLLILVALTAAAIGLVTASSREVLSVGREVTKQCSIFAGDTGLIGGQTWFRSQRYIGPPPRTNEDGITAVSDPGYWNTRNWGGIGDSDSPTVSDWRNMTPDTTLNSGTPGQAQVWFEVAMNPDGIAFSNRLRGEEAGRSVRYEFELRSTSRCPNNSVMQLEQRIRQTYSLPFYG